jgi:inner membrane protein COX18
MSLAARRLLLRPQPRLFRPQPQPQPQRRIHASAPRATFLDATTSILTAVHSSTGLPWAALIPLSAVALRACLLPLTLHTRGVTATMITLSPLLQAKTHQLAKAHARASDPRWWERRVRQGSGVLRARLWRRWGCQRWKLFLPMLQLPVWVTMSATLRALLSSSSAAAPAASTTVERTSDWLVDALGGLSHAAAAADGLRAEGPPFALDLALPDPTLTLPLLFFVALAANHALQRRAGLPPTTARQRVVHNSLGVLAAVMGLVACHAPAGLVLYWASSAAFSLACNALLHLLHPLPARVERCAGGAVEDGRSVMNAQAVVVNGRVVR